jgi:membrane protease YdiL (CAAX protease family)
MTSPRAPRTQAQLYHAPPRVVPALGAVVAGILTIYVLQVGLGAVVGGLVAAGLGYLVVILELVGWARFSELSLGLRGAPVRFFLAAVLVGLACWYVDLRLVAALQPPGDTRKLEAAVAHASLLGALVSLAVLPAVAEELLFRGVLARSLASRHALLAIGTSAIVFSAYHLDPVQIVGTFPLALALGTLAVRSGSILPGMLAHFLNNAVVIGLVHVDAPGVVAIIDQHPRAALLITLASVVTGVALAVSPVTSRGAGVRRQTNPP